MTTPLVVSTTPSDGSTSVTIDSSISFRFNTSLDTSTIGKGTVVVYEDDTLDPLDGIISYDSSNYIIRFMPSRGMKEDTAYKATIVGFDNSLGSWVTSADGDPLASSYTINFRTTTERYVTLEEVTDRSDIELVGPVRAVSATLPPALASAQTVFETITIADSDPLDLKSEIPVCTETITLTTSHTLVNNITGSSTVELEIYPALGDEEYFVDVDATGTKWFNDDCATTGYKLDGVDVAKPDFVSPTGEFSFDGKKIIWTRTDDDPCFMYNSEVHLVVKSGLTGVDSNSLTGTLDGDLEVIYTTEYWPKFVDQRMLRVELGSIVSSLYDDTLNRILHKNSIDAWEQAAGNFDIDSPFPAVKRYVKWASIVDVFDALTMKDGLIQGDSKRLGDFEMSRGGGNIEKNLHPKYKKAEKEKEKVLRELRYYRGQGHAQATVRGIKHPAARDDYRERTWDNWLMWTLDGLVYDPEAVTPGGNMRTERLSKQTRSHDHHGHTAQYGVSRTDASRTTFKCRSTS